MKSIFRATLSLTILIAASAFANASNKPQGDADITGSWDLIIETPQGSRSSVLVIKHEGGKYSGSIKSERGERALNSVALKGSDITFAMSIQAQGQDLVITYTGKVDKDSMSGEADFGGFGSGAWKAARKKGDASPVAGSAGAYNISGAWIFTVETQAGSGTPAFTFKQEGENLTGTYKGQLGEGPVAGTVKGSDIAFSAKVNFQGQDLEITYTGKIEGSGQMKGEVKLGDLGEGTWTARRQ